MDNWILVVIAGAVGFGLGLLVMWWFDRRRSAGSSMATLKKEQEQFREQVTDHFVETAERINRLTDSYKDLFDHLSQGAETLVDASSLRERMPRVSDQEVRLKRLGTRTASNAKDGDAESTPTMKTPIRPEATRHPAAKVDSKTDPGSPASASSTGAPPPTEPPSSSADPSAVTGSAAKDRQGTSKPA